jgi:hypothetical protein
MALITDPDSLTQGVLTSPSDAAWTASSGQTTTITGAATLPTLNAGDWFEVRDHSVANNNGLYEATGTPTTSSISCTKISSTAPVNASAEAIRTFGTSTTPKNVMFDTFDRLVYLLEDGVLSTDGVTKLALHSFTKEEWKNDPDLIAFPFPLIGINFDAGLWEWGVDPSGNANGWRLEDTSAGPTAIQSRRLVRNAGWFERDSNNNIIRKYFNVTTLGTFEDAADLAYYAFGNQPSVDSSVNYQFAGPVNEPVKFFEEFGNPDTLNFTVNNTITRATGSFITDGYIIGGQITIRGSATGDHNGTFEVATVAATTLTITTTPWTTGLDTLAQLAVDNANAFATFLRIRDADPNGKTYAKADLTSAGETSIVNKVIKFPLGNATDLKILETDANIDANTPYTEIRIRYLAGAYNREVDSATKRDFGIVVDVGTYSQSNGASAASTLFTSANINLGAGEALADYAGGSLIIHEGTDQGTHTISGTPVDNAGTLEITLTVALTATESNLSYTMERATPLTATSEEIFEKIQRQLRRTTSINEATGVDVIGRTADELLFFVGDAITAGSTTSPPTNPLGGGTGVMIEGFDSNDTNRMTLVDNTGTGRTFPFVAAGTINFNPNLVNDTMGTYWMYFTNTAEATNTGFGISAPSANVATLDSSTTNLASGEFQLLVGDYIVLSGFTNAINNGLYQVSTAGAGAGPYTAGITKVNGDTLVVEAAGASVMLELDPIDSPDALLVDNNAGADITGSVGAASIAFDFDYDNNVQGGRTAATDAKVTVRAIGLETAQSIQTTGTITRATGLVFSLVSSLERNYSNP